MKRAEGIVTLVVCNPNKKDKENEGAKDGSKKEKKGKLYHTYLRKMIRVGVNADSIHPQRG